MDNAGLTHTSPPLIPSSPQTVLPTFEPLPTCLPFLFPYAGRSFTQCPDPLRGGTPGTLSVCTGCGPWAPSGSLCAPVACSVFLGSITRARMCIPLWVAELKPHIPGGSDLIAVLNEVPAFPANSPFFLTCDLCLYKQK